MGVSGWELATVIQTPYLAQSTFTTYTLKLLMVFQRPIIPDHQRRTKELLIQQAQEAWERERLKFGAYGVKKSNSLPGMSSFGLNKPHGSASPKQNRLSPKLKRYVYGDQAVLEGGNVPNGAPKGAGAVEAGVAGGLGGDFLHPNRALGPRGYEPQAAYPRHLRPSQSLTGLRKMDFT